MIRLLESLRQLKLLSKHYVKEYQYIAKIFQLEFFLKSNYEIIYETYGAMTATEDYILAKPIEQKNGNANTEE